MLPPIVRTWKDFGAHVCVIGLRACPVCCPHPMQCSVAKTAVILSVAIFEIPRNAMFQTVLACVVPSSAVVAVDPCEGVAHLHPLTQVWSRQGPRSMLVWMAKKKMRAWPQRACFSRGWRSVVFVSFGCVMSYLRVVANSRGLPRWSHEAIGRSVF